MHAEHRNECGAKVILWKQAVKTRVVGNWMLYGQN